MKRFLLPLLVGLFTGTLHAGIEEEIPDFFPKGCDAGDGWALLTSLPKFSDEDKNRLPPVAPADKEWVIKADAARIASVVSGNKPLLEKLERAMASPVLHSNAWKTFEIDSDEFAGTMPALYGMRLMIMRDAVAARDEGKLKQGMETAIRCATFGVRVCEAEPLLIDGLVASTIVMVAARQIPVLAAMPEMPPDILRSAAEELERLDRRLPGAMRAVINGEARWSLRIAARLSESEEKRRNIILTMAANRQLMAEMKGTSPKTDKVSEKETDTAAVLRVWKTKMPESVSATLLAAEKVDWKTHRQFSAEWFRALKKADTATVPAFRSSFHPPDKNDPLKGTPLAPLFNESDYPTDEMWLKLCTRTSCVLRQARVLILLRLYELKHGKLPPSLNDLVPEFCASLPADPFDGKPIRYDWLSGTLWCVGMNLKDENGASVPDKTDGADDEALELP